MKTFTARFKGSRADLLKALGQAVKKATTDRGVLTAVGQETLAVIHEAFGVKKGGGTDAAGERWQDLAPVTVRKKKSDVILVEGGDLEESLKPRGGARPKWQVFRVRHSYWEGGTRRPFALAQHRGIPGRLPKRRLWPGTRKWPRKWWQRICKAATVEVVKVILREL